MVNMSRADLAYTLADLDSVIGEDVRQRIAAIPGVLKARVVPPPVGT